MIKYILNHWEENKEKLRIDLENNNGYNNYEDFARLVIEDIFPDWEIYYLSAYYCPDEVVFIINTEEEGFFVSSLCGSKKKKERYVDYMMRLAFDFIQNMNHYIKEASV